MIPLRQPLQLLLQASDNNPQPNHQEPVSEDAVYQVIADDDPTYVQVTDTDPTDQEQTPPVLPPRQSNIIAAGLPSHTYRQPLSVRIRLTYVGTSTITSCKKHTKVVFYMFQFKYFSLNFFIGDMHQRKQKIMQHI